MKLKHYEILIFLITLFLSYEYFCLNNIFPYESIIRLFLSQYYRFSKESLSPTPGYPISYFLGWLGFTTMILTNLYIIRKRFHFWENIGKTSGWLDFHIFCGLIGPIFIIFHSNFKVNGLVSISFWSMIICSSSGIIGRYFYIQTLKKNDERIKLIENVKQKLTQKYSKTISVEKIEWLFQESAVVAGAKEHITNPFQAFYESIKGDFRLNFTYLGKNLSIDNSDQLELKKYGIEKRRILFLKPFNRLLGYWHAFHLPFAIFMYAVAIIHIIAALLFSVKH